MKDDYSAVFRNLRTERMTERYEPIPEPGWLAVIGGVFAGIVGAFVLYLWCTI